MNLQVALTSLIWIAAAWWCVLSGVAAEEPGRPPNIILMMADDLGVHDLASYGQRGFTTPHTDRLAREGMRFTDAHSPSAICSPTRYAVVTGTDPFRRYHMSHVLFNGEPLVIGKQEATVASLLKQQGYWSGVVGKWHLGLGDTLPRDLNRPGRGPNDIGFDYSYLVPDGHNMLPLYYLENGEVEGGTEEPFRSKARLLDRVGYKLVQNEPLGDWENRRPNHAIGARLADRVDAFLERNRERPFFLYYPTCSIHFPTTPDRRFVGQSGIGPHGDYVMEFDWAVGRVLATLDRLGLADDTLLIVTSDNGGYPARDAMRGHDPNHPWRGAKSSALEGGHRVPLLARWSGRVAPGTVSGQTVSLVDMTATFCAIADAPLPADAALDSFDLLPILLGQAGEEPLRPYTVMGTRGMAELVLRRGPWKLIVAPQRDRVRLYHLDDDPREERDLSGKKPEIVGQLRGLLGQYVGSGSSRPGSEATGTTLESLFRQRDRRNRQLLDWEANGFPPVDVRQLEIN
ncbi:MAG: sulfatase family protein [Pirellulales bacterium]